MNSLEIGSNTKLLCTLYITKAFHQDSDIMNFLYPRKPHDAFVCNSGYFIVLNPFMHNVVKWPNTYFKNLAVFIPQDF